MRVYEEYNSPADKRRAQRQSSLLKRKHPTGQAVGYLLVFDEDGNSTAGSGKYTYSAYGELMADRQPGSDPVSIVSCDPSWDYLSKNCRLVGFDHIPEKWKRAFARKIRDWIDEDWANGKEFDRYRRLLQKVA